MNSPSNPHHALTPSVWIARFAHLVPAGARVLDLASGYGRHALFFAARGAHVLAIDRDAEALATLSGKAGIETRLADLEGPRHDPLGPLVEHQNGQGNGKVRSPVESALADSAPPAHAETPSADGKISARTARHRLQTPSASASGVTFQQRSQRRPAAFRKRTFKPG